MWMEVGGEAWDPGTGAWERKRESVPERVSFAKPRRPAPRAARGGSLARCARSRPGQERVGRALGRPNSGKPAGSTGAEGGGRSTLEKGRLQKQIRKGGSKESKAKK